MTIDRTLPDGTRLVLERNRHELSLLADGSLSAHLQLTAGPDDLLAIRVSQIASDDARSAAGLLGVAFNALFDDSPALREIALLLGARTDLLEPLLHLGFVAGKEESAGAIIGHRALLRQTPDAWLTQARAYPFPLAYTMTEGKRHPLRAPAQAGEVYRRRLPALDTQVSFRTVDPDADLEIFHAWHNNPRVSAFWELAGSRDMHREYLDKLGGDAHMHPVIGCFDGEPFGYFEIYWAREDRIAPYYEVDDYDRGIHMLVGEERFRGPHRVAAWLPSLAHFLFLDDPRTRQVVAEPRADNAKMIAYMQQAGFHKAKEFDFPHKRAALMILPREVFFGQFCP